MTTVIEARDHFGLRNVPGAVEEPEHSPKGASSAERWMHCPGSSVLLSKLKLPQTEEKDYQGLGTGAHEASAHCLQNGCDSWEIVGQSFHGFEVGEPGKGADDKERIDFNAVQMYVNDVRQFMTKSATIYIEKRIGEDPITRPHPDFYGTVDFAAYDTDELIVEDFKYGEGIVVEPEWNEQMLYYAYGILLGRPAAKSSRVVRLRICQPRAFHTDGPIREWATTAGEIIHWAETELIPAMEAAEIDNDFEAGKWCRFCPAKLFCPLLTGIFGAAAKADPDALPNFSNQRLGLEYQMREAVKFYMTALEAEAYRRLMTGTDVAGIKLVQKKSNRVFKAEAPGLAAERFGDAVFSKPELMSPAEMEKVSPEAKKFVAEYAFHPNTGLTVALESDRKQGVKVEKVVDVFAHMIQPETNGD